MKIDEVKKFTDVESQYGDHNTGVAGFNDGLPEIFEKNIHKEYPPLNKWEELKLLMKADIAHNVHYSSDKKFEHTVTERYLNHMEYLENKEKNNDKGFLFTDIPEFDKKQWEKMLKNLEGLA